MKKIHIRRRIGKAAVKATPERMSRQDSIALHHQDMSSDQILQRIDRNNTIMVLHEQQRASSARTIQEAQADVKLCDKLIGELQNDVSTLSKLIAARRTKLS